MKKRYLLTLIIGLLFLINGCSKDEQETNEPITTDISVTSSEQNFGWINSTDLNAKLNMSLSYNYGNALESEIEKTLTFNADTTRVIATINFKENFSNKYFDQNLSNNTTIIDLIKSTSINIEGNFANNYSVVSPPWDTCNITYSFTNYTDDLTQQEQIDAFNSAAQTWANVIQGLSITNAGFNNPNADIRILFTENYNHPPCPSSFQGAIAHAYFPNDTDAYNGSEGDIHFNDNKRFTNQTTFFPIYDLETVALHELGHSLGLDHSDEFHSIMYSILIEFNRQTELNQDDIDGFINLYNGSSCSNNGNSTIEITPNNWTFSNTEINSVSTQKEFTITNSGNTSFNVTNITSNNDVFEIVGGQSGTIQPSEEMMFNVTFNPTNTQSYNGVITVENDADNANSSNSTIQVIGTGVDNSGNSSISLSGSLNFGNVDIGSNDTKTFTIHNDGNQSFNVSSIDFPSNVYSANWNSGTINASGSQNVTVTFQPTNAQSYNGNVNVISDAQSGNNSISISGNGVDNNTGQPNLVFVEYDIQDDNNNNNGIIEAGEDIDFDIRIQNTGNATATNIEVIIDTNDPDINISDNDRPYNDMSQGDLKWNSGAFDFQVSSTCPTKTVTFTMQINSSEGSWSDNFTIDIQGQGSLPQVYATYSPRDSCSATGSSDNYELNLNTIYYRNNWNIDNILSYGSDGYRGMWYRFTTTTSGIYTINLNMNGNPSFALYSSCGVSPFQTIDNSNGNSESTQINFGSNVDVYIRFYDADDNSNIDFEISIEH